MGGVCDKIIHSISEKDKKAVFILPKQVSIGKSVEEETPHVKTGRNLSFIYLIIKLI